MADFDGISLHSSTSDTNLPEQQSTFEQSAPPIRNSNKTSHSGSVKKVAKKNQKATTAEFIKNLKSDKIDLDYQVRDLKSERMGLIDDLTSSRLTNDEITEELEKTKASRKNYKENFATQKRINDELNHDLDAANHDLALQRSAAEKLQVEVANWKQQASSERRKRKKCEAELENRGDGDAVRMQEKIDKYKETWQRRSTGLLTDFAKVYQKWNSFHYLHAYDSGLSSRPISNGFDNGMGSRPKTKKSRLSFDDLPSSPDSR